MRPDRLRAPGPAAAGNRSASALAVAVAVVAVPRWRCCRGAGGSRGAWAAWQPRRLRARPHAAPWPRHARPPAAPSRRPSRHHAAPSPRHAPPRAAPSPRTAPPHAAPCAPARARWPWPRPARPHAAPWLRPAPPWPLPAQPGAGPWPPPAQPDAGPSLPRARLPLGVGRVGSVVVVLSSSVEPGSVPWSSVDSSSASSDLSSDRSRSRPWRTTRNRRRRLHPRPRTPRWTPSRRRQQTTAASGWALSSAGMAAGMAAGTSLPRRAGGTLGRGVLDRRGDGPAGVDEVAEPEPASDGDEHEDGTEHCHESETDERPLLVNPHGVPFPHADETPVSPGHDACSASMARNSPK